MSASLILILVVAGAYLAAHVAFDRLAHRFNIISGAEYLLLGILIGPEVAGLISAGAADSFAPLRTLALGWIGVLVGTQFYVREMIRLPGVLYRVAFFEAILSLALVAGAMIAVLTGVLRLPFAESVMPAVAMGTIATVSSPSAIGLVARRLGRRAPLVLQAEIASAVSTAVAISAFALLLCIVHPGGGSTARTPTPTEWAVITVGIGCVGGALFHLFLGGERKVDRLFIALAGAIILASGAAAYLRLSPLLPAMLVGVILVNTSKNRAEIRQVLVGVERPLYFVLMLFAGVAWRLDVGNWIVPVAAFLGARVTAKLFSAGIAAALNGALPVLGVHWGRSLLGQGGVALAIGLNYATYENTRLASVVFTATIASVLLTDLVSARLAESVVRPQMEQKRRAAVAALAASAGEE